MKYPHVEAALRYARDVVAGKIPACKWVRLACERALEDRERARGDWPYRFDPELAERNCRFAECFPHVKGKWAKSGELYKLEPFQCFRRCEVFGWVRKDNGMRRFRRAYFEVPRKNGKSMEEAIDGNYCHAADGEFGAECYCGATTEVQAWEVFRPARWMAERTPEYQEAYGVEVNSKSLVVPSTGSRFLPMIGKPGDGSSPHWACADEYHEHETDDFCDTMLTGMMAREQPLLEYATTAGDNIAGPCYRVRQEVQKVLERVIENEELWGIIYTLDEGDDWTTEEALRKANPNFGVSVNPDILRAAQRDAIQDASKQGIFKTKHLNIWVSSRAAWFNMEDWHRCANPELTWEHIAEWDSVMGLDMALKLDFSCAVFVARQGDRYRLKARHYLPEGTAADPSKQHYLKWMHDGRLVATHGDEIDFPRVEAELSDLVMQTRTRELALDPDRFGVSVAQGVEARTGAQRVEMQMGTYRSFSAAMLEMQAAARAGRLEHDGDPVLAWMMSNVVAREDARGNLYPRKERPDNKIDGAVAAIIAWTRAMGDETVQSIYERHAASEWAAQPDAPPADGEVSPTLPVPPAMPGRSIYDQHGAEEWTR